MRHPVRRHGPWLLAWLLIATLSGVAIARGELQRLRAAFDTDARIAHRLLSQRAAQHDAILATLNLLQAADGSGGAVQRLPAVAPQVLAVLQRARGAGWADGDLRKAEAQSRRLGRAVLARADLSQGRYVVLQAGEPASHALVVDMARMVPEDEWPAADGPVRFVLRDGAQSFELQPGRRTDGGWHFTASKALAADSQPFELVAQRWVGWAELPWGWMAGTAALWAVLLGSAWAWRQQLAARRRAEAMLRLGQVARLNALGELAAGMAHELNQPLTAVISGTQAAARLLADDPPDLEMSRHALAHAGAQARRASDVLARLRRMVERPGAAGAPQRVSLDDAVRDALRLLEPECRRREVQARLDAGTPVAVQADPVALQQIVHNLVMNALQALEQVPPAQRALELAVQAQDRSGVLAVRDSGPGIAAEALPHLFEPFYSTRRGGLGLGLSLSETLALGMGGSLAAANGTPRGALFTLRLPLAAAAGAAG